MILSYEYRIYPSKGQAASMFDMLGDFCHLYNSALDERRQAYTKHGESLSYTDQALQLKECREVCPELSQWSFTALQQVLRRLNKSYGAFFRRIKAGEKAGFPRFRNRYRYNSADFRVGDGLRIDKDNRLRIVGVSNSIKVKWHRDLPSKPKSCILINRNGKWFVTFHVEVKCSTEVRKPNVVGIDLGLTSLIATSDGRLISTPQVFKESQDKRRRLSRAVARKKKGSATRRKAAVNLANHSRKIARKRKDNQHKLSFNLVKQYTHIAFEDLNIKGLARGMLAKSVHNAAWAQLISFTTYKAECAGGVVEQVDPRGTSQLCTCGAEVRKTLKDRVHNCTSCGLIADRDIVSGKIILSRASFGAGLALGASSQTNRSRLAPEAVCFR